MILFTNGKGGKIMQQSSLKAIEIKCPECSNFMTVYAYDDKTTRGTCNRCKSAIIKKKLSDREKRIRIIKN